MSNLSWYINLLVLAVVLALLTKHVVILKLKFRKISKRYNKLVIFKHLCSTRTCFDSYNYLYFEIIDKVNAKFDLKVKEALHINRRKPILNAEQNPISLPLSL